MRHLQVPGCIAQPGCQIGGRGPFLCTRQNQPGSMSQEATRLPRGFPLKFREDSIQAWMSALCIQSSKQSNINLMHRNEELRSGRAR